MKPVTHIHSRTAVLADENIDTDRIIPARFLTTIAGKLGQCPPFSVRGIEKKRDKERAEGETAE